MADNKLKRAKLSRMDVSGGLDGDFLRVSGDGTQVVLQNAVTFGGDSTIYKFNSQTGAAFDPTSGQFALPWTGLTGEHAPNYLYVHSTGIDGNFHGHWISGLDDSTSTIKGTFRIFKEDDHTKFLNFQIDGNISDSGSYYKIPVNYVYSSSDDDIVSDIFSTGNKTLISFSKVGGTGSQGATGPAGPAGPAG